MLRTILILSAMAAASSPLPAGAAAMPPADGSSPREAVSGTMLAQAGEVEIYYDERGRRVIIDPYTGEVLAIERPRRALRRELPRDWPQDDGYWLDPDPAPRDRGRDRVIGRIDEFGRPQFFPGEEIPQQPETFREDAFPPPPETFGEAPDWAEEPDVVTRAPLGPPDAVEPAAPTISEGAIEPPASFGAREEVAALQVLLDRGGASPGVIDGHFGANVDKAILNYREITGANLKSTDSEGIRQALQASGGDPFVDYTLTAEDAAGPFVAAIPADYGEKAKLDRLGYTSVAEALAERFHMDEKYLRALNPEANFGRPGTIIRVTNVGRPTTAEVVRIVADKSQKQVRAYDAADRLVAAYPATIGSNDTPSPSGVHKVSRVAFDPDYTYNPNINFRQGENDRILKIPPGPNGPVGSIWIALDKPTYGIHGTPDPSKIGKTESHGCVRLTNWDAQELARMVKPGVIVEFWD